MGAGMDHLLEKTFCPDSEKFAIRVSLNKSTNNLMDNLSQKIFTKYSQFAKNWRLQKDE
jgi:hypothetical protein